MLCTIIYDTVTELGLILYNLKIIATIACLVSYRLNLMRVSEWETILVKALLIKRIEVNLKRKSI